PPLQEEKPPAQGPLASEDSGKMASPPDAPVAAPAPPPPPPSTPPPAPKETKVAAEPPPPPKPKPRVDTASAHPSPKPAPSPPQPRPAARAPEHPDAVLSNALRDARYPGPAATRDEYLAYLVALTRQHI